VRILGIDPGLANTGYGIIDHTSNRSILVHSGTICTPPDLAVAQRLRQIHDELQIIIEKWKPTVAAIETLFFSTNVKTAISVAQGRGVAILATAQSQIPLFEYSPLQIKQAVTSSGKAQKAQVTRMVHVLLGLNAAPRPTQRRSAMARAASSAPPLETEATPPPSFTTHSADALAVALCHAHSHHFHEKANTALATLLATSRTRRRR